MTRLLSTLLVALCLALPGLQARAADEEPAMPAAEEAAAPAGTMAETPAEAPAEAPAETPAESK